MLRFILLLLSVSASAVCLGRSLDDVTQSGYIEIAVYADFPPYSYLDDEQQAAGIDVELGKLLAADLGVQVRWFWMTADENVEDDLRNAIWKGHYLNRRVADLMLRVPYDRQYSYAVDGYGQPKNNMVVMFGPYQRERWLLARDLEKIGKVRNLAIFQYQKVGVEIDSLPDTYLSAAFQGRLRKQVVHYTDIFEALQALSAGEISAVAGVGSQIEWGLREHANRFDIDDDGLEQITKKSWDIGMAVKHTHRQLANAVELIMEELVQKGRVKAVFDRFAVGYELPGLYQATVDSSAAQ